jgi:hypothetical protein
MRIANVLLIACSLVLLLSQPALAVPKGKNGESCNISSDTNVDHTINGKNYKCDKCVYSVCSTSGSISNCQNVTHWSNCEEVASNTGGGGKASVGGAATSGGQLAPPEEVAPSKGQLPKAGGAGAGVKSAQ